MAQGARNGLASAVKVMMVFLFRSQEHFDFTGTAPLLKVYHVSDSGIRSTGKCARITEMLRGINGVSLLVFKQALSSETALL